MNEIRDVGGEPLAPVTVTTPQDLAPSGDFINRLAVAQVVGLETESERAKYEEKLDTIITYARNEGFETPEQLKWIVKSLMDKMGTPGLTERWVTKLSRFCFLDLETKRLEREKLGLMR